MRLKENLENKALYELEIPNTILHKKNGDTFYGKLEASKIGMCDKNGKVVIPCEYDFIYPFEEAYAIAIKNNKKGIIDINNKVILPFEYEDIKFAFKNKKHYFIAKQKGKWGVINEKSDIIIKIKYKCIFPCYNTALKDITFTTEKHSAYNSSGKLLVKHSENLPFIKSDINIISKEGIPEPNCVYGCKYGCVDENGQIIIPVKHSKIEIEKIVENYKTGNKKEA